MKKMVIPFLAAFVFFMSSFDNAQGVTLDKPHDFTCATCHTPHKTLASTGYNNICLNCHRGGDPMAGAKSFAPGDAADPFNIYTTGVSNRYQTSHRWDGKDINARVGATVSTLTQMTSVRSRTSGALACVRCHNPHSQVNKPFLRTANSTDQMCTDCHSSRNKTDHKTGTHPVGIDYPPTFANLSAFKATPENSNPANPTSALKLIGGKVSCSTCHGVHATDSNSATFDSFSTLSDLQPSDGNLLHTDRRAATADGLNICTNCHAKKVAHNGRGQNIQCTDCHGAHVDTGDGSVPNVWLVKRDMGAGKGTVQFTSVTTKNYMDGSGKGVCQSCHAVPTGAGFQFHLTETNATCNNCHRHGNSKGSFTVDASGACNTCHGYPPLLNNAGSGGYAAGYDATTSFVDESTSGHVSHAIAPYQKACSGCHSGNNHMTGTYQDVFVGSANYDTTARTCSNIYCHSNASPRGGANITKTTPSWDGAKGKIIGTADECKACHNAAGDAAPSWSVSHTKHINGYAANAKLNCNACHAKTAASNAAIFSNMTARSLHTNGVKDVAFNSFAGSGSWDSGSATCSNLYCHSNVQGVNGTGVPTSFTAATWNGSAMNCGSCHASMTADIPSVTGNHKLHVQGYGFDCATCHGSGYSAAGNAVPAVTHVDGIITMSLTGTAAVNGAIPSYYQGNNSPGDGYKNCANIYCHSTVQGSGGVGSPTSFASPVWGTSPLICGSCHANMAISGAATGSHIKHAQKTGYSCVTCHNGAGKDPNPPYAAAPKHANGTIEISFSGNAGGTAYSKGAPITPGAGYGSCSTVSCHADPYSAAAIATTAVWGATTGCATCHNGGGAFGAYSSPTTGSHVKHIAGTGVQCNMCHVGAAKGATGGSAHINGVVNVDVNLGYYSSSIIKHAANTYAANAKCSTAVCHADPYSAAQALSPVWGTASGCESCHNAGGAFTGTGNGPATGSHDKHMAATTLSVKCGDCHSGAVANSTGGSAHANGVVNVTQGYYSSSVSKHAAGTYAANAKCSTTCHSPYTTPVTTPAWGTVSVPNCASCHDSLPPTTGSHGIQAHGEQCSVCHDGVSIGFGSSAGTNHFNGTIDVLNGYPVTSKHTANIGYSGTCSTAICHADPYSSGMVSTPVWGTTGNGCTACHTGANAITATGPATGSHTTVASHAVACITCHAAGTTATTAPGTGHADGDVDVANVGYLTLNKTKGTAGVTCSNAFCHVSPVSTALIVTPAWGSTGNGCVACHAGANIITANGPATGSHTTVAGHAVACITCHATGTTATVAPSTGHADGNIDVVNVGYLTLNKTKGTAGVTCSNASCHVSPVSTALIVTPAWGSTGNGCVACHAGANAITANGPATGSHTTVAGHAVACITCHAADTTATVAPSTGHADGDIDVANVGYLTLNKTKGTAGVTCSTASCHVSPVSTALIVTPVWGSTGNGCTACHAGANAITATGPATGSHTTVAGHAVACITCHATGTTATVAPNTGHADGNIDVVNVGYLTLNKAKGTAGTSCSATVCHGASSPAWGTVVAGVTCTKCHGKPTLTNYSTANAWQAAPGYAQAAGSGTYTNNVSDTAPYGAHDAHVRAVNQYTTRKTLCSDCHGTLPASSAHADGLTMAFSDLAKNIGTSGGNATTGPSTRGTLVPAYSAGSCSAIYCHGGVMAGTDTTPEWRFTGTSYLTPYAKNVTNCGKCHAALPVVAAKDHSAMTFDTQACTGCHGHEGNGPNHIDGILQAGGSACNSCHGYQAGSWATAPSINPEGKGAHEAHITWLTTKRFPTITLTPATDGYASGATTWTNVCGVCHGNTPGNHNTGTVNVELNATFSFGGAPAYNGTPGVSSATLGSEKTCSNISCHYFTTPLWSTY